ncbi:hypothetical protein E0H26_14630 [Micromonospora zingiberis]|uniref:Uncharacterized protein n=1 Tax=Micromonospora zingiberis TaxID=2053011 RepID=A0A4R0GHK0_9ACTN|nr:hypothetical protein [Micromonospora zingiberis]TCB96840.1 hypothetical protein E0H26_14630 [Micromonospora zingiberis]
MLADTTSPLERLVLRNPGTSVSEMRAAIEQAAAETGLGYDELLAQAVAESERAVEVEPGLVTFARAHWIGLDGNRIGVAAGGGLLAGVAGFLLLGRRGRSGNQGLRASPDQ